MSEEKVITPFNDLVADQYPSEASKLQEAVEKFQKQFVERSFSQRHEELGKMIDCHLCGRRHREGDLLAKMSRAHAEQKRATQERISVENMARSNFSKPRFHPHHNDRVRQFARLAEQIFLHDIQPFFQEDPEHPGNLIRRAQRRAALILKNRWAAALVLRKHTQDISRRVNFGLLPGGSR